MAKSLLNRRSSQEYELVAADDDGFPDTRRTTSRPAWLRSLSRRIPGLHKLSLPSAFTHYVTPRRCRRSVIRLFCWSLFSVPPIFLFLVLLASIFFPSYTYRPAHYNDLRKRALEHTEPGRANPYGEKVFITATLAEDQGHLSGGAWGRSVVQLVDLLGPDNVHLSIYEDNADDKTKLSLDAMRSKISCNSSIVYETLDASSLPRITLPTGEIRLKRITFLAEVRNRALAPIDSNGVKFDKVLFLNDIMFDPIEAAQLLFATNINTNGRTDYEAACAVDFIMPLKFYDRFATRDMEGYITGIPFFPWFTSAGSAESRKAVIAGKDAVPVRSCWGGMVAFNAKWFQDPTSFNHKQKSTKQEQISPDYQAGPLHFRYDREPFWESSECCLIHADLQYQQSGKAMPEKPGIYMNPFIRVAYDEITLSWLSVSRRPEKLYSFLHNILNHFVGFPEVRTRYGEEPGQTVIDVYWEYDDPAKGLYWGATQEDLKGHYANFTRVVQPGHFCGSRNLLVINEKPEHGHGRWGKIWPPHPSVDSHQFR